MRILIIFTLILGLIACNNPSSNTLIVGVIAGPEAELMKVAKEVAYKQYKVDIKIVEFNDYNIPNVALQDKSLDANVFQHFPYLQAAIKSHDYKFDVIGKTFVFPIGLYSKKIKKLAQIPVGARIAIPNDPSNEVRALLVLQDAGLIKVNLSKLNSISSNPLDAVVSNFKSVKIKEIDAAQLPRVLPDVEAAVINSNYATFAGLSLALDAIYVEKKDSPYAIVIVTRHDPVKKQQLDVLVTALHSIEVRKKAEILFDKSAVPAW